MTDSARNIVCAPVPVEMVDRFWRDAMPLLFKAEQTSNGRMNIDELYPSIMRGRHMLWIVFDTEQNKTIAAFTTRVAQYAKIRAMVIEWMGGTRMKEWIDLAHSRIKEHARLNECTRLEASGRNAWVRWASRVGWEPEFVNYKLEM